MHLCDSHSFVLLFKAIKVFAYELIEPLTRPLTASFLDFVEVDHAILEVDDLEVGIGEVHLVQIPHDVRNGSWPMKFSREFIEYKAHSCHILY